MASQELVHQQQKLNQSARNLEAFAGEWVVLRGDTVADHDPDIDGLINRDAIQKHDAIIYVEEKPPGPQLLH